MLQRYLACAVVISMFLALANTAFAQDDQSAGEPLAMAGTSNATSLFDRLTFSAVEDEGKTNAAGPAVDANPFDKGSFALSFTSSGAWGSKGDTYMGHVAVGYYAFDHIAFELEAYGGGVMTDQASPAEDHGLYGIAIRMRHHLIVQDNWSFYFDIGAGTHLHTETFPEGGTHQNFSPQMGFGVTVDLNPKWRLMVGGRWLHFSNASRKGKDNNPGYDAGQAYVGLMTSF